MRVESKGREYRVYMLMAPQQNAGPHAAINLFYVISSLCIFSPAVVPSPILHGPRHSAFDRHLFMFLQRGLHTCHGVSPTEGPRL